MHSVTLRSSSRLKAKAEQNNSDLKTPAINTDEPKSDNRKKARTSADGLVSRQSDTKATVVRSNRIRGKTGRLGFMAEMPLDVLLEIFVHLQPQDVVSLSRTTKSLRQFLFSPMARLVWRSSVAHSDPPLPICPPDMTLVPYIMLLFGKHCNFCAAPKSSLYWDLRVRCCGRCPDKEFVLLKDGNQDLRKIIPSTWTKWGNISGRVVLRRVVQSTEQELKNLEHDKAAYDMYVNEREKLVEEMQKPNQVRYWECKNKMQRRARLTSLRNDRREAIFRRLSEESDTTDWSKEMSHLRSQGYKSIQGLNVAKLLTDRDWENIRPNVIAFLEEKREDHLREERNTIFRRRFSFLQTFHESVSKQQPKPVIFPSAADLLLSETFYNIIFNTPLDVDVNEASFENTEDAMLEYSRTFRQSQDQQLISLIPKKQGRKRKAQKNISDAQSLQLASTLFRCVWCNEALFYPRVLVHQCLRVRHQKKGNNARGNLQYKHPIPHLDAIYAVPWGCDSQISFDDEASFIAKAIIKTCNEDPETVTVSHMNDAACNGVRVECTRCAHESRGRLAMTWSFAISHEIDHHSGEEITPVAWKLVTNPKDMARVQRQEAKGMKRWTSAGFYCIGCDRYVSENEFLMRDHAESCHTSQSENGHAGYYRPLDISIKYPPYAVRIP